ncbi:hypothetical protein HYT52_01675 [Candidatus Woesearchaeota archaeon]|nr:hypothetical protein [Candidatus Woesearchaeota archaeon]
MNEILKSIAVWGGSIFGIYTLFLAFAQSFELFSERIRSEHDLKRIVNEEADKLGMSTRDIVDIFYEKNHKNYKKIRGARCHLDTDEFEGSKLPIKVIEIKEGYGATRAVVRHELYHLYKHLPRKKNIPLMNFFYEEPTATLYALTGLKL